MNGQKEIPGIWIGEHESASFWLDVCNDLKNRGVEDILIACKDGLSGFSENINAVFPRTRIQLCVIVGPGIPGRVSGLTGFCNLNAWERWSRVCTGCWRGHFWYCRRFLAGRRHLTHRLSCQTIEGLNRKKQDPCPIKTSTRPIIFLFLLNSMKERYII